MHPPKVSFFLKEDRPYNSGKNRSTSRREKKESHGMHTRNQDHRPGKHRPNRRTKQNNTWVRIILLYAQKRHCPSAGVGYSSMHIAGSSFSPETAKTRTAPNTCHLRLPLAHLGGFQQREARAHDARERPLVLLLPLRPPLRRRDEPAAPPVQPPAAGVALDEA